MTTRKSDTMKFLEDLTGGPLTFGELLSSIRQGEELTLKDFALKLDISVQHLCNIEKGLKRVSADRAIRFAKILGFSERQFLRLSFQDEIGMLKMPFKVLLEPMKLPVRSKSLRIKKTLKVSRPSSMSEKMAARSAAK